MPPPTTSTRSVSSRVDNIVVPSAHLEHARDRTTGRSDQDGVDRDLMLQALQGAPDVGERDPLHVRAQIAGPHELDVRVLQRDVVAHRALGHEHDPGGTSLADIVHHRGCGAREIRLSHHLGWTFWMSEHDDPWMHLAEFADVLRREPLMHLAVTRPGNHLNVR